MNEKRLQVLFISSWYPFKERPLLGVFVKRHAVALAKVCDVSALYVYGDDEDSLEEVTEDGVFTMRLGYRRVKNKTLLVKAVGNVYRYISAWKKLARLYVEKKGAPDIVNLNVIIPAAKVARYIKNKWGVPYVISEHWTGYFPEDGRYKGLWRTSMAQRAVKNASAVITVSNDLKNQMIKAGLNNEYHVISNIVDTETFNISLVKQKGEKVRFVHVSALDDKQKNIVGMINVCKRVHSEFPNIELTVVGELEPETKEQIEEIGKSSGWGDFVHFVGRKVEKELVELLQNSDAFILFSNYETQAVVLLESICCGTPVIATRTGGVGEYVNDKNGILIEPKNEEQLYNAMVSMVKNRDKFGAPTAIRETVINMVSADSIAKQYLEIYNKVLGRK